MVRTVRKFRIVEFFIDLIAPNFSSGILVSLVIVASAKIYFVLAKAVFFFLLPLA